TSNLLQVRELELANVTSNVDSTLNVRELGESVTKVLQVGVVGETKFTANGGELGEGDVSQLLVGHDSKRTLNLLQLGGSERLEKVETQLEGLVNSLQLFERQLLNVLDGQRVALLERVELDGTVVVV